MVKALIEKRAEALRLRKLGWSYSRIKNRLGVSKSSLSYWLRRYPLTKEQLNKLVYKNDKRIERFIGTMRKKREDRLNLVYSRERKELFPLTKKEHYLAGLFLYWGEGGKTQRFSISLSNTDPRMINFFIEWIQKHFNVPKSKIVARLHLYKDMSIKKETDYWSRKLKLNKEQFRKPYIKITTLRGLTYKTFGHGTCNVFFNKRDIAEKVFMGMKALADKYE